MTRWLKRLRGAVGMGLTWAAAWSVVGAVAGLVSTAKVAGLGFGAGVMAFGVLFSVVLFGSIGLIGGVAFSVVLGLAERNRSLNEMSLLRFAAWGAVAAALVPLTAALMFEGFTLSAVLAIGGWSSLGVASATGSLALARRADRVLEPGDDVAQIES